MTFAEINTVIDRGFEMHQLRYMCSLYGSQNCPMSDTREMIYDICPL